MLSIVITTMGVKRDQWVFEDDDLFSVLRLQARLVRDQEFVLWSSLSLLLDAKRISADEAASVCGLSRSTFYRRLQAWQSVRSVRPPRPVESDM